jgi:hypothetical protein
MNAPSVKADARKLSDTEGAFCMNLRVDTGNDIFYNIMSMQSSIF